ncbi:MAG TPA: hypothetical protein VF614_13185 [Chthoniobacteraceae bacterium]|jgi:hypothetical protein
MLRAYYSAFMTTISLKVSDRLGLRLSEEAQRRRTSKSALVRECVEKMLLAPSEDRAASCLDLAGDLAGCLKGPRDIAINRKYLDDFGQ